ncbi:MAG: hypothetical protein J5746_00180, partial [Victivallales bacterium]|nr:hypothetical protein [Victivallales bacterium]
KMRGQYGSAMEHAIPEQFWVDRNKCSYLDDKGNIKNPSLPQCAEAISAVKAIAIAQNQGQKIYTINKDNAATALPKLSLSGTVGAEIRNAIEAGKEVTFHEKAISAHGWSGQGYIIVDPETGAGAYLIEGKGNGGWMYGFFVGLFAWLAIISYPSIAMIVGAIGLIIGVCVAVFESDVYNMDFNSARLIGTTLGILMGIALNGYYIYISLPVLFVLGFTWLIISVAKFFILRLVYEKKSE